MECWMEWETHVLRGRGGGRRIFLNQMQVKGMEIREVTNIEGGGLRG